MDDRLTQPGAEAMTARLVRGVVGGMVAGVFFIAVTMWFATSMGGPANAPLKLISSIVLGKAALAGGTANPVIGMVVHLVLSAVYGMVFAVVVPMFRTNGTVALAGMAYGLGLFVVNFLVVTPLVLTQFTMINRPFELVVHLVFGALLAPAFFSSGVRSQERLLSLTRA